MIGALIKQLFRRRMAAPAASPTEAPAAPLRLHIGGVQAHPDWKILNIQAGPGVDFVGSCSDLSAFGDATLTDIYASHVLEHLGYRDELPHALAEMRRALRPAGTLRISVPDIEVLAALLVDPSTAPQERFHVMRMMFGGQVDAHDFHRVGLNFDFLAAFLRDAGFDAIERVDNFGLFEDTSTLRFRDRLISLNVQARKPVARN